MCSDQTCYHIATTRQEVAAKARQAAGVQTSMHPDDSQRFFEMLGTNRKPAETRAAITCQCWGL